MNVRLRREFGFSTGIVFDDRYVINQYFVALKMLTASDDHYQQNIAYERVKYWLHNILDSAVIIQQDHPLIPAYMATGQRVITVSESPVDQIMGIMLYSKLNAITQERLIITDVEIHSVLGDSMIYLHNENESVGPFAEDGWWQDPRPVFNDIRTTNRQDKIVSLDRVLDWKDVDLDWEPTEDKDNTVVFADFKRNETE